MKNRLIMKIGADPEVKIYKNPVVECYTLIVCCPLEGKFETYETTDWDDALATAQDIAGETEAETPNEMKAFAAMERRW